jgi:hypothetical protein
MSKAGDYINNILFSGPDPENSIDTLDQEYSHVNPTTHRASPFKATDFTETMSKQKNYVIYITHLPSGTTTSFKGMLTQYSDNFASNWTSETVYGRMDDIYTFQNTKRSISLGFVAPAFDITEARRNLLEVTNLARQLYPTYSGGGGALAIARAPILRLKFTNLIRNGADGKTGLLGKMQGFSFTPDLESGFFDFADLLYPKTINISFTYDVLHEHRVGWDDKGDWDGGTSFPYLTPGEKAPPLSDSPGSSLTREDAAADLGPVTTGMMGSGGNPVPGPTSGILGSGGEDSVPPPEGEGT